MVSDEATRLLTSLRAARRLFDRLRGNDPRQEILDRLAALGEFRIVPELLPFFAAGESLAEHAARAIASLLAGISPAQLA